MEYAKIIQTEQPVQSKPNLQLVQTPETSYQRMKRLGICPHCSGSRRYAVRISVDGFTEYEDRRCPFCSDPNAPQFGTDF